MIQQHEADILKKARVVQDQSLALETVQIQGSQIVMELKNELKASNWAIAELQSKHQDREREWEQRLAAEKKGPSERQNEETWEERWKEMMVCYCGFRSEHSIDNCLGKV